MCGRFALKSPLPDIVAMFNLICQESPPPRYNIAPGQPVWAICQQAGKPEVAPLLWGLVPEWAKDPAIGNRMINARAEGVAQKPAFRDAYRYRRCVIPADGFYEWGKTARGKQPYFIHRQDNRPLWLAGLWEHWQDAPGNELETCTIITTSANELVGKLHDRMPVILELEESKTWLNESTAKETMAQLLRPAAKGLLQMYPVSPQVNRVGNDSPSCIAKVEPQAKPAAPERGLFD